MPWHFKATEEIKFELPGNLGLRYNGHQLKYCWWDETIQCFRELCNSTIQIGSSKPTTITLVISPLTINIFEDGNRLAVWSTKVSSPFCPVFNWQILSPGGTFHATLSDLINIESRFTPGMNTPWDFAFSASSQAEMQTGAGETWIIRHHPGEDMAVIFSEEGYMRISTPSLEIPNSWVFTSAAFPLLPPIENGIIQYRFRVNSSGGSETKVAIYGGLILRITANGRHAEWDLWVDDWFVKQSDTSIVVGSGVWTVVSVVYSQTHIALFEEGEAKFSIPRQQPLWKPNEVLFYVQHLNRGTAVNVDISHVRCVPGIKSQEAMVKDLRDGLLLSYPMESHFSEAISRGRDRSLDLVSTDGISPERWIRKNRAMAIDFAPYANIGRALKLAVYPCGRSFEAYTFAATVRVETLPSGVDGEDKAGILGPLALRPDGRLEIAFQYASDENYSHLASTVLVSRNSLPLVQWFHVTTTYSYEEARWALYINGELDSVVYVTPDKISRYAITPVMGYIGAIPCPATGRLAVLQGQICDVAFWKQPIHSMAVRALAMLSLADKREDASPGGSPAILYTPHLHKELQFRSKTTI